MKAIVLKYYDKGNEYVLLGKRRSIAGEDRWHVPEEHRKVNERFSEAVEREVKEEAGIDVKVKRILWVEESFAYLHHVNLYFEAELVDPKQEPKNLEPKKFYEWRWFRIDNLPSPLWTLEEFFKQHKNKTSIKKFGKNIKGFYRLRGSSGYNG
ncbi:MAG: hypothetical protein KatS3mg090_0426 [Patescibacteria group bacterium]|nr:MAG: hypothetical protein KatS3mg090_0426 [Patescibacteria group bacterium]